MKKIGSQASGKINKQNKLISQSTHKEDWYFKIGLAH